MSHLKKLNIKKTWPINRKGTKFIVKPSSTKGIPLLIVLRDMLEIAQNRREVKKALYEKKILLNEKPVRDEKIGVSLFDLIGFANSEESYRLIISPKGKYGLEKVKNIKHKISKVADKKLLKGKKVQLNLSDGKNFITNFKCNTGDSVLINLKEKKVEKCLPLVKGANVFVFSGKHMGKKGKIEGFDKERNISKIKLNNEKINVLNKHLIVIE